MNNPKDYTNYSGGAEGADKTWDKIGRKFGVGNHVHYRPSDLKRFTLGEWEILHRVVRNAATALGRPYIFKGIELVQRNWLQVDSAEAIYAVSRIVEPGAIDKGFINKSGKQVVSGGTGWAVEMAIQMGKGVSVFDMNTNKWYFWDSSFSKFLPIDFIPTLTHKFAGIGSRLLTPEGENAIRDVYAATFPS